MRFVGRMPQRLGVRLRALGAPWEVVVFLWLPLTLVGLVLWEGLRLHGSLADYEVFRKAAAAILHGRSPYVAPDPHHLAGGDKFVYPPATGLFFAPFVFLPATLAHAFVLLLTTACVPAALRLLDVRDWRCYGLALATAPVVDATSLGTISSFLLLGAAAAWRLRDRPAAVGACTAASAVAKLVLWPLGIWLLATRRSRAAIWAALVAGALVAGGWAVIGFAGLGSYPHLLGVLSHLEAAQSYSLLGRAGLSGTSARLFELVLCAAAATGVVIAARGSDGDRRAFSLAVVCALLVTPVLWLHYLVLLFVPIALHRPRLSPLWFAPLAFWATPLSHVHGDSVRPMLALALVALIGLRVLRAPEPPVAARRALPRRPAPASS
jgi:alpha-1,2-mannosyltransferase